MPVWHASVSLQSSRGRRRDAEHDLKRHAIRALAGVGGDREWWYWNPVALVGHLRVALTPAEYEAMPTWCGPIDDAGESGPERERTR